jgi:uncharacterized BrkB/YihY/UPF0761 family membrane protein
MLWLYWSGITFLLGGELNAEIEKAARAQQPEDEKIRGSQEPRQDHKATA